MAVSPKPPKPPPSPPPNAADAALATDADLTAATTAAAAALAALAVVTTTAATPPSPHPRGGAYRARNRRLSTTPTAADAADATPTVAGATVRTAAIAAATVAAVTAAVLAANRHCPHRRPPWVPAGPFGAAAATANRHSAAEGVPPPAPDLAVSRAASPSVSGGRRGQLGRVVGASAVCLVRSGGRCVKPPTDVRVLPPTGTWGVGTYAVSLPPLWATPLCVWRVCITLE